MNPPLRSSQEENEGVYLLIYNIFYLKTTGQL